MFHCQPTKSLHYQRLAIESEYRSSKTKTDQFRKYFSIELWCGCSLGNLRVIDVRTAQLSVQLSHQLLSGSNAVHLICASRSLSYQYSIWTAMKTSKFLLGSGILIDEGGNYEDMLRVHLKFHL